MMLLTIAVAATAAGREPLERIGGPVEARVVKVRDGDTIEVEAFIWPLQSLQVAVRLRGIDAPELRGKCTAERRAAETARDRLSELVGTGPVRLSDISGDKYFGRVLARVAAGGDADLGRRLLAEGLVARYDGGHRQSWCDGVSAADGPHGEHG